MSGAIDALRQRLREAWVDLAYEVIGLVAWVVATVFIISDHPRVVVYCLLLVLATTTRREPPRKRPTIATASIEPSSDLRVGARAMAEIRTALLAAGYTDAEASRQLADMIAAENRGGR